MNLIITASAYALFGDVLATFLAATLAIAVRQRVSRVAVGVALGGSAGFILGVAFFDSFPRPNSAPMIICSSPLGSPPACY